MSILLSEIARALGAELLGDGGLEVEGAAEPGDAGPRDIALAMDASYADALSAGQARCAVLWEGADWRALGLEGAVTVRRAAVAMVGLTQMLDPGPGIAPGIHPSAVIDPSAQIGPGAAIGPLAVIGRDVIIGEQARIGAHVSIGDGTRIGAHVLLHPGVRVGTHSVIGDHFIAHFNTAIGADGFAFKTLGEASMVERSRSAVRSGGSGGVSGSTHWSRVHSLGNVEIGDRVELGANSAIDKGTIRATRIGSGTKIDNQVQIGHNCEIGEDCLIAGSVGIAGSVKIGNRVVLGGQVGVSDNLFIGDDVLAGGRTAIFTNVPKGRVIWGMPAVKMETQIAINKEIRRLPRLAQVVRDLQKAVSKLTEND